jgi:hypothetical protein
MMPLLPCSSEVLQHSVSGECFDFLIKRMKELERENALLRAERSPDSTSPGSGSGYSTSVTPDVPWMESSEAIQATPMSKGAAYGDVTPQKPSFDFDSRLWQGLDSASRIQFWEVKHEVDERQRFFEKEQSRLKLHAQQVMDKELTMFEDVLKRYMAAGRICRTSEYHFLPIASWTLKKDYPYAARSIITRHSEVWLRGINYRARMALHGPAAICQLCKVAEDHCVDGEPCKHCQWTRPAEFQLLRNVARDGPSVMWPPYFKLYAYDPATEELDELLDTLQGIQVRDSEHPHVFPSDEVGWAFPLDVLPTALAGLETTLPTDDVRNVEDVAMPRRPLYLVLVVPEVAPLMVASQDNADPLRVQPLVQLDPRTPRRYA